MTTAHRPQPAVVRSFLRFAGPIRRGTKSMPNGNNRALTIFGGCCLILMMSLAPIACGQESAPASNGESKAELDASLAEYKKVVRQIEQLRNEFQLADAARRESINAELSKHVAHAKSVIDQMVAAGTEVYRAAPNQDPQVTDLLLAVAQDRAVGVALNESGTVRNGGDQYESALPIINALIEGGADQKMLPVWGVICAFATNNYDLAEKYYQLAQQQGAFADAADVKDPAQLQAMNTALQYGESIDRYRKLWSEEQALRAAEAEADNLPRVKFTTSKGDVVIELFENEAPTAVANFVSLVKQGFYDGLIFHRVLSGFMVQGGCPEGTGTGGPGFSIACECYQPNHRKHFRGSLSMAHSGRDTGGSQFFLTFVPTGHLDGRHTVFGRVIDGIEVLGELQDRDPSDARGGRPLPSPDRIVKAEVLRDRGHDYSFEKLPE